MGDVRGARKQGRGDARLYWLSRQRVGSMHVLRTNHDPVARHSTRKQRGVLGLWRPSASLPRPAAPRRADAG